MVTCDCKKKKQNKIKKKINKEILQVKILYEIMFSQPNDYC